MRTQSQPNGGYSADIDSMLRQIEDQLANKNSWGVEFNDAPLCASEGADTQQPQQPQQPQQQPQQPQQQYVNQSDAGDMGTDTYSKPDPSNMASLPSSAAQGGERQGPSDAHLDPLASLAPRPSGGSDGGEDYVIVASGTFQRLSTKGFRVRV